MKVTQKTAEWAADEFINYFSNFDDIEDYLRFVKKEVLSSRTSLVSLSDEFFRIVIPNNFISKVHILEKIQSLLKPFSFLQFCEL